MAPRRKAGAASSSGAATALQRKAAPKSPAPAGAGATANKRRRVEREFLVGKLQAGEVFTFGSNPFGALGLGEDVLEKFRAAHVELVQAVQILRPQSPERNRH